jgi:hypothetical protein
LQLWWGLKKNVNISARKLIDIHGYTYAESNPLPSHCQLIHPIKAWKILLSHPSFSQEEGAAWHLGYPYLDLGGGLMHLSRAC